jgi:hypothetical protein
VFAVGHEEAVIHMCAAQGTVDYAWSSIEIGSCAIALGWGGK